MQKYKYKENISILMTQEGDNFATSEGTPEDNTFTISKVTARLLELFQEELQRRIGLKVSKTDAIAFIIEDYTKGYYGNLVGTGFK